MDRALLFFKDYTPSPTHTSTPCKTNTLTTMFGPIQDALVAVHTLELFFSWVFFLTKVYAIYSVLYFTGVWSLASAQINKLLVWCIGHREEIYDCAEDAFTAGAELVDKVVDALDGDDTPVVEPSAPVPTPVEEEEKEEAPAEPVRKRSNRRPSV